MVWDLIDSKSEDSTFTITPEGVVEQIDEPFMGTPAEIDEDKAQEGISFLAKMHQKFPKFKNIICHAAVSEATLNDTDSMCTSNRGNDMTKCHFGVFVQTKR